MFEKKSAISDASFVRREAKKTGGGNPPNRLTPLQNKVVGIIGDTQIDGIAGGIDTCQAAGSPMDQSTDEIESMSETESLVEIERERLGVEKDRLKIEQERLATEKQRLEIERKSLLIKEQKYQLYLTKLNLSLQQMGISVNSLNVPTSSDTSSTQ
ncbi:uncharacterized protein LOC143084062 [Mytilus galloprovincialis]|uniref:uncharacterized protein LOC143084062 n=1 Tax=Mytilus galloprovincialis TaxID=29158 RepID=UPI003F7CCC1B